MLKQSLKYSNIADRHDVRCWPTLRRPAQHRKPARSGDWTTFRAAARCHTSASPSLTQQASNDTLCWSESGWWHHGHGRETCSLSLSHTLALPARSGHSLAIPSSSLAREKTGDGDAERYTAKKKRLPLPRSEIGLDMAHFSQSIC